MALGEDLAWVSDIDKHANLLIAYRYPDVPNLGDVKLIDWHSVEPVDILTAGYPCQPFSTAGKRKGIDDERHIWPWIIDGIRVLRPRYVFLENVAGHLRAGFGDVLGSLAEAGYDAQWTSLRASDVGACHRRERVFILASLRHPGHDARGSEQGEQSEVSTGGITQSGTSADRNSDRRSWDGRGQAFAYVRSDLDKQAPPKSARTDRPTSPHRQTSWEDYEPAIRRWESVLGRDAPYPSIPNRNGNPVLDPRFVEWMMGLPPGHVTDVPGLSRNQQLKILGNGVVPQQARYALSLLMERS